MKDLLVLENTVIQQMLNDSALVTEFPFLKAAADRAAAPRKRTGCGSCGNKMRSNVTDYEGLKAAIAGLPDNKKLRLKQLLDAEQLRLYYTNSQRQRVKLTF